MNDDTGGNKEKLWLDAEFRRQYPLTTQRLKETALQHQVDLGYERYMDVLRSLHAAAELFQKELTELIEKEGVLELIGEDYPDEEDFPRPSPEEVSKSLEGIWEMREVRVTPLASVLSAAGSIQASLYTQALRQ